MANLAGFDASQVPEQADFSALPEGKYVVIAIASEEKPNSKGTGTYLQFTFEVLDGPCCKGRRLWARLNLKNPSSSAVEIAQRELGAICRATGVIKPTDSSELHNKPILVTVKVEVDEVKKRENNTITKYEAVSGPVAQMPAAAPAFSMAPPPAAATGVAPWMR